MDATDNTARNDGARTWAEAAGLTAELGDAIAALAEAELEAGRADTARAILEGLVVSNPHDAIAWALLSRAHRKSGQPLAARFCAEVGAKLAPEDPVARLARAECLLSIPECRNEARAVLGELASDPFAGGRARALLGALRG